MVYKGFTVGVSLRIGLILASMVCLAYIFARTDLFFTQILLALILIFQVYNLVHFVTQTNRELARFLQAIKHRDYSISFSNRDFTAPQSRELNETFNQVMDSYQQVEAQRESQYQYFKRMIEQVNVGIISLNGKQEIALINQAAQSLLMAPADISWAGLKAQRSTFTNAVETQVRGGSSLIEIRLGEETRQFSVRVDFVLLLGESYRIILFQDIRNEIEQKEIEAWHKLIRILTHEIMNSVTPVVSLTETMLMILGGENGQHKELSSLTEDDITDIRFSLQTIQKRSSSLLHFLNDYRKLTRIPAPSFEKVVVADLFAAVTTLLQGELRKKDVKLTIDISSPSLTIEGDFNLLEQVLINLLTNSLQATSEVPQAQITLKAFQQDSKVVLEVIDNGKGIEEGKLDKIFIPFYSTKAEGSGIGLSLSKQIMNLHKGSIKVQLQKEKNTCFQLLFPQR